MPKNIIYRIIKYLIIKKNHNNKAKKIILK